jgi:hypothetical protein
MGRGTKSIGLSIGADIAPRMQGQIPGTISIGLPIRVHHENRPSDGSRFKVRPIARNIR